MRVCLPHKKFNTIHWTLSDRARPRHVKRGSTAAPHSAECQHFVSIVVLTRCARSTSRCRRCGAQVSVMGLLARGSQRRFLWSALSYHVRRNDRTSAHHVVCEVRP